MCKSESYAQPPTACLLRYVAPHKCVVCTHGSVPRYQLFPPKKILPQHIIPNSTYTYMGGSHLWISTLGFNMWLHSFHAKIHVAQKRLRPFPHRMAWAGSGWIRLALACFGLLWLVLAGSGWCWLALAASGWLWLDVAGPWLALVGCPKPLGKTIPDQ